MNKARRQQLSKAIDMMDEIMSLIEQIKNDEQEAFDNMPEGLQMSERGEQMEGYIDTLAEISESIFDMQDQITEIIEG